MAEREGGNMAERELKAQTTARPATDEEIRIGVRLTPAQFREINRRAGLDLLDGKARGEYIVGCLFDEPHDALLARVRETAETERARFRAEVQAQAARTAARRAAAGHR